MDNPKLRLNRWTKISGTGRMETRLLRLACEKCLNIEKGMSLYASDDSYYGRQQFASYAQMARTHDPDTHEDKVLKKFSHEGNGAPSGVFAGTLTKAPDWKETEDDMIRAMHKIMEQKTCPVEKYAWYLEYTNAGTPHIHFVYQTITGGRIHQKVFKRYWKQWSEKDHIGKGFIGGYHKHVTSELAYLEYIKKDEGVHMDRWTTPVGISPA